MEHGSELVAEGRLIGDTAYPDRAEKFTEIEIDGIKIDFFDARKKVVHEVKKSASVEHAHIAQVQYYLYKLWQKGIDGATGLIEYPKLKQRKSIASLTQEDLERIRSWDNEARQILEQSSCPPVIKSGICKKCAYQDFCYSGED